MERRDCGHVYSEFIDNRYLRVSELCEILCPEWPSFTEIIITFFVQKMKTL